MKIDFQKYPDGLVPTIVQDAGTQRVLMLGFMNAKSFDLTQTTGKVTFYSRSRRAIWIKGETSGNFLRVENVLIDCDTDTILIKARPTGPVCHTGADTCFGEQNEPEDFLLRLAETIKDRKANPKENSYTAKLFASGLSKRKTRTMKSSKPKPLICFTICSCFLPRRISNLEKSLEFSKVEQNNGWPIRTRFFN